MKSNTIYPPMSEREISGAAISREAATQGMVLLKNINGVLPLKGRGKIALFGNGAARTIRGGTGSGDPFNGGLSGGGMTRSYAVKYSLIVSVPAIIGATIVELATMGKNKIVFHPVYLVGVFMAALAGYFTIRILMRVVKKRKLKYFALYCLLVGTFSIAGYFLL